MFITFRKQLLDERSRFSEEIKNTNRCEKELMSYRTQLDTVTKRKVKLSIKVFIILIFTVIFYLNKKKYTLYFTTIVYLT